MYVCISLRSFVYIYKDRLLRYGWIPWVAIAAQIVLGLATMDNPFQIVSIFIPCWVCWYLWYWHDDKQKIRFGNIVNNGCWGIYNGIVGLWIVVLMRVIVVISNAVSIARTYREEKIQERAGRARRFTRRLRKKPLTSPSEKMDGSRADAGILFLSLIDGSAITIGVGTGE